MTTSGDGVAGGRLAADLRAIRRRSALATDLVLASAGATAVALALLADPVLVLLPVAFVIGWLNLVGL